MPDSDPERRHFDHEFVLCCRWQILLSYVLVPKCNFNCMALSIAHCDEIELNSKPQLTHATAACGSVAGATASALNRTNILTGAITGGGGGIGGGSLAVASTLGTAAALFVNAGTAMVNASPSLLPQHSPPWVPCHSVVPPFKGRCHRPLQPNKLRTQRISHTLLHPPSIARMSELNWYGRYCQFF